MKNRQVAVVIFIISISLISVFLFFGHPKTSRQYNVLLITIDSLRPDHLSCYGYKRDTSPNIDKFAKDGVLFTQAISQSSKTIPSVPSIMTSLYPAQHGIATEQLSYDSINHPTLAGMLKENGYYTAGIVAHALSNFGLSKGFDSLEMAGYIAADSVTKKAESFLEKNKDKKFFLWLHYIDPHAPYKPPFPYNKKYINDGLYILNKNIPLSTDIGAYHTPGKIPLYAGDDGITDINHYIAQYDGEISFTDEHIGVLLEKLKDLSMANKTIVIITSDHGEYLGEREIYFSHGQNLYDTLLKVPLIFKCDSLFPRGKIINQQVALIDIMPTILDFLKITNRNKVSGISLIPMILKDKKSFHRVIFSEIINYPLIYRSLRADGWKLIWKLFNSFSTFELYDLQNDPAELNNLRRSRSKMFENLKRKLIAYNKGLFKNVKVGRLPDKENMDKLKSLGYLSGGQELQDEQVSIARGYLKLVFNQTRRKAKIYYKGVLVTGYHGIFSSFEINGRTYSSSDAVWQVARLDNYSITLYCNWPKLLLQQIWTIEILPDGKITWEAQIDSKKEIRIRKWNLALTLSKMYSGWVTVDESQKFTEANGKEEGVVLKDLTNRYIGVVTDYEKNNYPGVIFATNSGPDKDIPAISNNDGIKVLFFQVVNKAKPFFLSPGMHNFFSGKIALLEKTEMEGYIKESGIKHAAKKEELQRIFTIKNGDLGLFFDYGQGRIYYQGRELTSRFGLYTSLLSEGVWHDSQNAVWEIKKVNDHKISAWGVWVNLPIAQYWELELSTDKTISWKVNMRVYSSLNIEEHQASIMLLPGYRRWLIPGGNEKGAFPANFNSKYQGWKMLYDSKGHHQKGVAVGSDYKEEVEALPSIVFNCPNMSKTYMGSIKNTDKVFKSRVLCCYENSSDLANKYFSPGEYPYFSGTIEIDCKQ